MEDVEIYDDLDNFDKGISLEKFERENADLTNRVEEQELLIQKMSTDIYDLQISNKKLQMNISELFKTAKAEITRKERDIADLRRQLDDMIFQRQVKTEKQVDSFPDKDDMIKQMSNLKGEMVKKNGIITHLYKKLNERREVNLKRSLDDVIESRNKRQKYNNDYDSNKSRNSNGNYTNKKSYTRKYRSRSRSSDKSYRHAKSRSGSTDQSFKNTDLRMKLRQRKASRSRSRDRSALSKDELMRIYGNARSCDGSDSEKIKFRPKSPNRTNDNKRVNMPLGPRSPPYEDRISDIEKRTSRNSNQLKTKKPDTNYNSDNKSLRNRPYNDESADNSQVEKLTETVTYISDNELLKHETNCNDRFSETDKVVPQSSNNPRAAEIVKHQHYQFTSPISDNEYPMSQSSNSSLHNAETVKNQSPHRKPKTRSRSPNKISENKEPLSQQNLVLQDSKYENNLNTNNLKNRPDSPIRNVESELQRSNSPPHDPRAYKNRKRETPELTKINIINYEQSSKQSVLQEQSTDISTPNVLEEGEVFSPQYGENERSSSPLEMELIDERNKISEKILSLEEDIRKTKQHLHKKSKLKPHKHKTDTNESHLNSKELSTDTPTDPILKPVKKHKNDDQKSIRLKRAPNKIKSEEFNDDNEDDHKQSETKIDATVSKHNYTIDKIEDCHKHNEANKTNENIEKQQQNVDHLFENKLVVNKISKTNIKSYSIGKNMKNLIDTIKEIQSKTDDIMSVPTKESVKIGKEEKQIIDLDSQIKNKIENVIDKKFEQVQINDIENTDVKSLTKEDTEKPKLIADKKEKKTTKRKRLATLNQSPRTCIEIKSSEKESNSIPNNQTTNNDDKIDEFRLITKELTKIFEDDIKYNSKIANEEEKTKDVFVLRRSPRKTKLELKPPISSSKIQNKLNVKQQSVILKQDIRNVTLKDILGDSNDSKPQSSVNSNKLENTETINIDTTTKTNLVPEQPVEKLESSATSDLDSRKKLTGRRRRAIISIT